MTSRPFYGWTIITAAFSVLFVAYGAQYCFGVFFNALLDEFAWSRSSLAGAFSLYTFGYCVCGFPAGRITDRWGPRAVITAGALFLSTAFAGMALVTQLWQPYILYGVLGALGMGTAYVPCNSTVVKWFVRRRGLAVGLATTGGSVGTFVLPPVAQMLVASVGWRTAYVIFGAGVLVALTAAASLMRRDPESMGQHPDGDAARVTWADPGGEWPLSRAIRTRTFWLLGATFTATWMPVFIPVVHLVPLTRDLGHSPMVGAYAVSTIGASAVAGRLVMGWLSDRMGRRTTIAISMVLQTVSYGGFAAAEGLPGLFLSCAIFGYSYGTISTLFPAIVGDFFGRGQAGALVGFLFMLAGAIGAWGPLWAGAIYDATGGYGAAFALAGGLNVLAAFVLALTRPPGVVKPAAEG